MSEKCSKRVFSGARWDMTGHMCSRGATVESGGKWWCAIHSPDGVAARKKTRRDKYDADNSALASKNQIVNARFEALEAIKKIAAGANDAREIALAILAKFDIPVDP